MKNMVRICPVVLSVIVAASAAAGQTGVRRGPDPTTIRDAALEKESLHNLEVARHYFKMKKAYRAALDRVEEIIAGNPNFSRLDEALYIAGMSSLYLAENKGKQAPRLSPEKLRDDARIYFTRLVREFPDSPFRKEVEERLTKLGGPKTDLPEK